MRSTGHIILIDNGRLYKQLILIIQRRSDFDEPPTFGTSTDHIYCI